MYCDCTSVSVDGTVATRGSCRCARTLRFTLSTQSASDEQMLSTRPSSIENVVVCRSSARRISSIARVGRRPVEPARAASTFAPLSYRIGSENAVHLMVSREGRTRYSLRSYGSEMIRIREVRYTTVKSTASRKLQASMATSSTSAARRRVGDCAPRAMLVAAELS